MTDTDIIDLIYRALKDKVGKRGFKEILCVDLDGDAEGNSVCITTLVNDKKQNWCIESAAIDECPAE